MTYISCSALFPSVPMTLVYFKFVVHQLHMEIKGEYLTMLLPSFLAHSHFLAHKTYFSYDYSSRISCQKVPDLKRNDEEAHGNYLS